MLGILVLVAYILISFAVLALGILLLQAMSGKGSSQGQGVLWGVFFVGLAIGFGILYILGQLPLALPSR